MVNVREFEPTFYAVPIYENHPFVGFQKITNTVNYRSSPNGWNIIDDGLRRYTAGNNVESYIRGFRGINNYYLKAHGKMEFGKPIPQNFDPYSKEGKDLCIANSFYVINMMHDISYEFEFTEDKANYQQNNKGKGGRSGDPVLVWNHLTLSNSLVFETRSFKSMSTLIDVFNEEKFKDYLGWRRTDRISSAIKGPKMEFEFYGASFELTPDGVPGIIRLGMFPGIDGIKRPAALDNTLLIHEYTHGIVHRMVGGPTRFNCLQSIIGKGLTEGYADTVAVYLTRKSENRRTTAAAVGAYVTGAHFGFRKYRYTTNKMINPMTLKYVSFDNEKYSDQPHYIGTFWANVLFEVFYNLVDKHSFTSNWMDSKQKKGNIIALKLLMTSLTTLECEPNFLQARNAILQADTSLYKGENQCELWKAFAVNGLGHEAKLNENVNRNDPNVSMIQYAYIEDFSIPRECRILSL